MNNPTKKVLTLCMVFKDNKILLGMKKRGFGAGRWNGFGGKVEAGETIESAAIRELKEEVGIEPVYTDENTDEKSMKKVGILEFSFENDPKILEVHVFKINNFKGNPTESEEMRPDWFDFKNIPFNQMWSDDEHWFPYLLSGKLFKGSFLFDKPSTAEYSAKIVTKELNEVESL